jgi:competence protein ComEA
VLVALIPAGALAADPAPSKASSPSTSSSPAPATATQPAASRGTTATEQSPAKPAKKVDLNNASLEELKTLPTVSEEYAQKIIAHRPYKSKGELVTKAGLPEGVYHAVKHKVEMQAPRKPAPKK